jgi:2-oxoisovalerate dehydrogenase E1 component
VTAIDDVSTRSLLTEIFRGLLLIRRFEERLLKLHGSEIQGSIHLSTGQEAVPVGALRALEADDHVVATYRGHGWAIACGVPLEALFAEITGRAAGTNGGRGGSAYLSAPDFRFVGENSIVGAGLPIANGWALAAAATGSGSISLVSFGDGATNQGAAYEAIVFAIARKLPVVFVCENNGWSEMTAITSIVPVSLASRALACGLPAVTIDGNDPSEVEAATAEAADRARNGGGPTFVECTTTRLAAHYQGDVEHYRPREDRAAAEAQDPIPRVRRQLLDAGLTEAELAVVEDAVDAELAEAETRALRGSKPDPASATAGVYHDTPKGRATPTDQDATTMTYAAAVNRALEHEMDLCSEVIVFGEDVAGPGGVFGVTRNLQNKFGHDRVFDTPIAEAAILGAAVGAADAGLRPVVEIMFADFLLVALDQLVNQAANVAYLSSGSRSCPLVVRTQHAITPGSCAQHTQALEAFLAHVPGLRVGTPATPQDAYAMTRAAIQSNDPCILYESRALYQTKGPVVIDAATEDVGGARLVRTGTDLAIVSWGRMVGEALAAAEALDATGVDAAVLDLRWLDPLDIEMLTRVVTGAARALVVHEANVSGGFGAEVVARIIEGCFFDLEAPPTRLGLPDIRVPAAPSLQKAVAPDADAIVAAANALLMHDAA